ncbi:pseudaminic acid synthase [uncultured Bacteroides sp.]|uniref:pseudaminic acid synthase n=1 Tax=uncultured Bacteroides sp. TaxID=162156 RepID=UPI0025D69D61|nr:pseudaminic acid synthase [uncultured Bacteroides sp.]
MSKTFIIAELSANHNHNKQVALDTIRAAKQCGADAVKIQTYTADTMTIDSNQEWFKIHGTIWNGENLYHLYQKAYTPWEWHEEIFHIAEEEGLVCFSTPFDKSAVDFLENLNNPIYKIASFEITDVELIKYAASKGKPMIISTGIATLDDINLALQACRSVGNEQVTLLKCTSAYPAQISDANLSVIADMRKRFHVPVGLSDHTMGTTVAVASVAMGATVIEKHFIMDRKIGGPDASFSMEPDEFASMVKQIREVENAMGHVVYPTDITKIKGREFCRSLFVVNSMKAGDVFTENNVRSIRPGNGLEPKYFSEILGKKAVHDIERGTPLSFNDILE